MNNDERIILLSDAAADLHINVERALSRIPDKVNEAVTASLDANLFEIKTRLNADYSQVFENLKAANESVLAAHASVKQSADWLGVKVVSLVLTLCILLGLVFGGLVLWSNSNLKLMRLEKEQLQADIDALKGKGAGYLTICDGKLCAAYEANSAGTWSVKGHPLIILKPIDR